VNKKVAVLVPTLIVLLLISGLTAFQLFSPSQTEAASNPFYVGIEFGYGNVSDCKALVDKVCNYTNLLVISTSVITQNEAALNDTCNYAYAHGMHLIIYFTQYSGNGFYPYLWAMKAHDTYGSYFLGAYIYDEVGGEVLDHASGAVSITYNNRNASQTSSSVDYRTAAANFVANANLQADPYLYCAKKSGTSVMTADYGLYWFDYKAGYATVLTEFGWGNDREMDIALCRGAATAQGKDWGAIICWEENVRDMAGTMENGTALYNDLTLAYDNGAKYAIIFDYAGKNSSTNQDLPNPFPYGILADEHFEALQQFWAYIQQNPERHGIIHADTALVLPEGYGFGFRLPTDKIWGLEQTDQWGTKIWTAVYQLFAQHNYTLDIVYSDPEFAASIAEKYANVIPWDSGASTENCSVINLNSTFGYSSIQEAINSGFTGIGDILYLKAGIYHENVLITKSITLMGENKLTTIIDGGNNGSALRIASSNVVVEDLTIINGNLPLTSINDSELLIQLLRQIGVDASQLASFDYDTLSTLLSTYDQTTDGFTAPFFNSGIYLLNADNCRIINNVISNCTYGIALAGSKVIMRDNSLTGNQYNFGVTSVTIAQQYAQDIDSSNTVNSKPIYYWVNETGLTVPTDAGYVALVNCDDVTVENLQLSDNYNGLLIVNTQNALIKNNSLTNNYEGLRVVDCTNSRYQGNSLLGNVLALSESSLSEGMDSSNLVNGKPMYVWVNEHDKTVPADAGVVALINCSGITVQNLNLADSGIGVLLENSSNCTITGSTFSNMTYSIRLLHSTNVTVTNNTITKSNDGILVDELSSANCITDNYVNGCSNSGITIQSSTDNTISGNVLSESDTGISIADASNNTLQQNVLLDNNYGVEFTYPQTSTTTSISSFNTIIENNFTTNNIGIIYRTSSATNNTCYHNNFIENQQHAYSSYIGMSLFNVWDNGSEGNYWSNYNGTDFNGDGIGDQPMAVFQLYQQVITSSGTQLIPISSNEYDLYPLMQPYTPKVP
jgi:parallel beta-helix repeat protein